MAKQADFPDRYEVRGNDIDGAGFVIFDNARKGFIRDLEFGYTLRLATKRQADALCEIMNIEESEKTWN